MNRKHRKQKPNTTKNIMKTPETDVGSNEQTKLALDPTNGNASRASSAKF